MRFSPKTGRPRKRGARPRLSLSDRLANLHLLLRSTSFARWPLEVTFYAEDVFRVWQKWTAQGLDELNPGVEVTMDESSRTGTVSADRPTEGPTGIRAIDIGYSALRSHLEKATDLLSTFRRCTICHEYLRENGAMTLVCPTAKCDNASHLECFATHFLTRDTESLVPITGDCPSCGTKLQWADLVKELSLRIRGEKEVDKIFKVRKPRGAKGQAEAGIITAADETSGEEDEELDDLLPTKDGWHCLSDESDIALDQDRMMSDPSPLPKAQLWLATTFATQSEPCVEESDWDDAEILT